MGLKITAFIQNRKYNEILTECVLLPSELKDKVGNFLYFSDCQRIPQKDWNQHFSLFLDFPTLSFTLGPKPIGSYGRHKSKK